MPKKHGFMTPKAIANRQKAKGLQKLRWYCQMCNKQCRDQNGFKCHKTSEAHMRNMTLYQEDPDKFVRAFSEEFEHDFMRLFRNQGGRRVLANSVYREYIKDRNHFHMNATVWETLTSFVVYLGKEGKAEVDKTERGYWIKYIDRDPGVIRRQKHVEKVLRLEAKDRQRAEMRAEEQRKRAMEYAKPAAPMAEPTELVRSEGDVISLKLQGSKLQQFRKRSRHVFEEGESETNALKSRQTKKKKGNALESLKLRLEEEKKEKKEAKEKESVKRDPKDAIMRTKWLTPGIILKVIKKGFAYHKQKGEVLRIEGQYGCVLKMKDGKKIILDQKFLETVMPANGRKVKVLFGQEIGQVGTLKKLDVKSLKGKIDIGGKIIKLPFEWFTKVPKAK